MTEDYTIPSDIPAEEQTGSAPAAYSRPLTTTLTTPAEEQQAEPNDNLERYNQIVSFLGKGSKLSAKKTAEELTQSDLDAANTAYLEKINSHMESIGAEPFPDLGSVDFDAIAKKEEEHEVKSANERLKNLKTKYPSLVDIPEFTDKKDLSIRSKDIMKKIQQISASGSISDYNKKVKDLNKSMPGVALKEATSSSDIEKVSKYNQGKYEQYVSTSQKLSAIANTPYRVSSQGELLQSQEEIKKGVADIPAKMYREYQRGQAIMSKNPFVTPESKNLYFSKATSPEKVGYQWDKHTPGPKPAYTASLKPGVLSEEDQRLSDESDVYSSNIKSIDQTLRDLAKKENEVKLYGVPVMGVNGNEELRKIELERTAALAARRVLVDKNADVVTSRHEVRSKIGSTPGAFIYSAIESSSNILNGISDIVAKYGANKLSPMFSALAIASGDELSQADEATKNIEDQISQKYDEFYESIKKTASSALGQAPENIEKEHKTAGFLGSMIPYVVGGELDFPMMFASSWHENKKELEGQDIPEVKKLLLNMSLSLASASLMKYGMKVSKGDAYVNNLVRDAIESQTGKIEASVVNSYIRRNAVRYAKEAAIGSASTAAAFAAINPTSIAAASSIKYLSNLFPGREVDVDNLYDTASHMGESILSGIQDGLIFGGIMHTLTTGRTDFSDYNDFKQIEAFTDPRYRDALKSKIQQNLAEGIIDKAQADAMLKNIKEISDKLTSIPDSFSGRDKFEAYRILRENERISKESENLDPTFKELYQKRIDANKEKLKQLSLRHDQVYQHEKEGGSTFVRGRNQLGEKVSSVSIFPERTVKIEGPVTQEDIDNFKEANKDLLEGNEDILSVGTWKDKDGKTHIDISAITPHAEAEALGRMYNQKAVFNLEKNKEVSTGGTGEPMEGMKSEADRVKDIRELVGRTKATEADFKPIGVEEVASRLGEGSRVVKAVRNAMSAVSGLSDKNNVSIRFHDTNASMQHALNIGNASNRDAKITKANFAYVKNDKGGWDMTIDVNLKSGADEATIRHEFTHGILLHAFGEDPAMFQKMKDAFRSYGNMFNDSNLVKFADMYDKSATAEEYLAELSAISKNIKPGVLSRIAEFINNVAAKYLGDKFVPFKDVNDANDIIRYFGSLSSAVRTGKPVEIREMKKQAEKEIDPEVLENGLSTNIGEPSPINEIDVRSKQSLSFPKKPLPLSFVTDKDIVDMDDILKDIYDNGKTVWFWMADQLGRGMYRDEVLNGEHYLDAGPSFALDPENRNNGILWASGLSAKYLAESAEKADYIFFISGSPEKAKMFNKAVLDLVGKRIDAGIGFDKFKKGVKKFGKKTEALSTMIEILDRHNSFKSMTVSSKDRKPFLLAIDEIRQLKTTPKGSIKQFLEKSKAIVNPNELRDGFYKDNGFEQNDIMLIGKPTGAKEGSSHGTYLNTVLGEVIGVPSKKINAWELMPEDVKKKYPKAKVSQKAKIIAAEMGKFYEGKGEERELAPKEPKSKQRLTDTERELLPIRDGWYSGIEKRLIGEKSEKQSAAKWLAGPVIGKGDEAIYTGVRQWLESKNPQDVVTKSEISKWMKENPVEIREIVKGAKGKMSQEEMDDVYNSVNEQLSRTNQPEEIVDFVSGHLNSWYDNPSDSNYKTLDNSLGEINMSLDDFIEGAKDKMDDTRYHKYQLPGDKTDYKEVLVTLPISKEKKSFEEWVEDKYGETIDGWSEGEIRVAKQQYNSDISSEEWTGKQSVSATKNVFKSTHFDEPNILVHLRMNTRTDADGNKVLFLEEVQSDWGQTGKKEGFIKSKEEIEKEYNEADKKLDELNKLFDVKYGTDFSPDMLNSEDYSDYSSTATKRARLGSQLNSGRFQGVSSAPFVTDTKAWTKLGLKMAIKEAIRQGVDKIAWTTGEQQADRYDLSKQVDGIEYKRFKKENSTKGMRFGEDFYSLSMLKDQGMGVDLETGMPIMDEIQSERDIPESKLESYVGKELAKKIIDSKDSEKTFTGVDLKVGGKGMEGFYDNIVPNSAKSLIKELTGKEGVITQVKFSEPKNQDVIDRYNRARQYGNVPEQLARDYENALGLSSTQQAIDITPELKAAVEEGLPMFSKQQLVTDKKMIKKMTEDEDGNYLFYHYSPNKIAGKIDPRFFGRNPKTGRDERPGIGISMYYTRPDYRDVGGNYGYVVRVPKDKVYPFNEDPLNLYDKAEATFQKMYPGQAFDPNKQVAFIAQEAAKLGYDMTVAKWGDQLRAQTTKPMKGEWYEKPHPEYRYSPVYNPKLEGFQANEKKPKSKQRLDEWEESRIGKGDRAITDRNENVKNAAEEYYQGNIDIEEYNKIVDKNSEISPITSFIKPAKEEDIIKAVGEKSKSKVNLDFEAGKRVGLRLDIPAYTRHNIWAITVHENGKQGIPLSYNNVARIKNVEFVSDPTIALDIARHKLLSSGERMNKTTIARMMGDWAPIEGETSEDKGVWAMNMVDEIKNNPEWSQIGMNPFRHSYFYDRATKKPVIAAEEVIQIGGLVYAKNVKTTSIHDERFTVYTDKQRTVPLIGKGGVKSKFRLSFGDNVNIEGVNVNIPKEKEQDILKADRSTKKYFDDKVKGMKPSGLSKDELKKLLDSDNMAILTGTNPDGNAVDDKTNDSLNKKAEEWLKENNYKYHEVTGKYGQTESSFIVEGMTAAEAMDFAERFKQDSVAHSEGLVYRRGAINRRDNSGDEFGVDVTDPEEDFVSAIKTKDGEVVGFKIGYDLDKEEEYNPEVKSKQRLDEDLERLRKAYSDVRTTEAQLREIEEGSPTSLKNFIKRITQGTTQEDVNKKKAYLVDAQREYRRQKEALMSAKDRQRGANFIIEKLSKAARVGDISQDAADLAIDLVRKNPSIFEDLAISITKKQEGNENLLGWYRSADSLVKIFKNGSDDLTATHELLHHSERFLPQDVRDRITKEWSDQVNIQISELKRKLKTETNPEKRDKITKGLLYLGLALESNVEPSMLRSYAMRDIMKKYLSDLDNSWYKLYSPSEWWAVNASEMMRNAKNKPEMDTFVKKVKYFFKNIIDSARKIFNNPLREVERGINTVLEGKTLDLPEGTMIADNERLTLNMENEPKSKQRLDDTGMKFKDEMQKEFDRIKDTDEKGRLIDRAISKASESWAKWIRGNQDQYDEAVRQFKKDNGIKVKSAPSHETIFGEKPSKMEVDNKGSLKAQIKLEMMAAMGGRVATEDFMKSVAKGVNSMAVDGVITPDQATRIIKRMANLDQNNPEALDKFYKWVDEMFEGAKQNQEKIEGRAETKGQMSVKNFMRSVADRVKSMAKRGVITANQASAITKRMAFLNPKNAESVNKFYDWVDKIFSNAEYADKLKEASTNRNKIKGKLNSKETPPELAKIAKRFSKIDPSEVSDIDEYNNMSKMLWEGLRPNVMKRDKYGNIVESKREAVNMKDMNRYIESQEDAMQKKKEKAEKAAEEDPEIIQNLQDSIDQLSDIARSILETGINPIDGTSVDLTSKEKSILKKFLDMKPKEKKTLMDTEYALKHFIENGDTGLMEYARERYDIDRKVEAGINALKRATGLGIKRLPVEWVVSAVRSLKNIIPTKYEESMRDYQYLTNSSISRIDTLLRNIEKGSPVFKTLFRDIAAGYSFYRNKTKEMNSEKIYQKMLKGLKGDIKEAAIAKYKITMYLRQLEHESNPGSSKSLPAMDYMKATIEAAKLGTNNMSKYSRKVLEKLIQEYSYTDADGVQHIDKDKIYDSLSEPEKNAVSEIQKLYKDLLPFAKTVAEKIRNNPFDEISNYVSIAVNDSSLSAADINTLATEMQAYLPSSLSTKAGQIEDRTGVARSIDMDPFSTASKAVRNILLDHSMTSNIMALRRITKDFREESMNGDDDVRLFAIALDNISNEVIKSVVGRSYTERTTLSEAMDLLTRKSVTYMLAGVEKITKETGSNMAFAAAFAPVEVANGAKYMKYWSSGLGGKILEVVNSYNQDRLYPHGGDVGKVADTESYDISVSSSQNIPSDAQMIAFKAYYNTLNRAIKVGRAAAEAMLSGPDIAMARPLWFGSMAMEFKRITGKEIDFDKIANSDAEYLESNMSAIEQARDVADKNVIDAANTKNPFLRSPKLTIGGNNKQVAQQLWSQINNFLSGFSRKEFEVLIDSIDTLYREGQITRTQAVKTIAAVTARAATYRVIGKVMARILGTAGVYLSTLMNDDEDDKLEAAIRKKISKNPSKMEMEAAQVEKGYFTEYSPKIEGIDTSINVTNRFMTSDEEAVAKMDKRLRPKRTLLEEGLHGAAAGIAQLLLNRNFGNLQNSLITAPLFEEYINSRFINNENYDKYEDQYLISNLPSSKQDLAKELLSKTTGPLSLPISGGIDLYEEFKEMKSITDQLEDVNNKLKDIDAGTPVKEFGSKDKGKLDSDKKRLEERYEKSKRIVATKISIGAIGSLTAIPGLKDIIKVAKKASEDVIIKTTDWDKLVKWYEEAQKQVKGSTIPAGVTPAFNRQPQQSQYFKMTSKGYKLGPKGWYK